MDLIKKAVDFDTMRQIDRVAIEEYGIQGIVLMEHAGRAVADAVRGMAREINTRSVTVFCGKGNNAGDGFVAARWLKKFGMEVYIFLLADPENYKGDALVNYKIAKKINIQMHRLQDAHDTVFKSTVDVSGIFVDAIFGTGFRGDLPEDAARVIEQINHSGKKVASVDIPSGLIILDDNIAGLCVQASITVTFALPKKVLVHPSAENAVGRIKVADIGIPDEIIKGVMAQNSI